MASEPKFTPNERQHSELGAQEWSGIYSAGGSSEGLDEDEEMADFVYNADPAGEGDSEMENNDMEGSNMEGGDLEGNDLEGSDLEGGDSEGSDSEGGDLQEKSDAEDFKMRGSNEFGDRDSSSGCGDSDANSKNSNADDSSENFNISVGSSGEDSETDDTETARHNSPISSREKISRNRLLTSLVSHRTPSLLL